MVQTPLLPAPLSPKWYRPLSPRLPSSPHGWPLPAPLTSVNTCPGFPPPPALAIHYRLLEETTLVLVRTGREFQLPAANGTHLLGAGRKILSWSQPSSFVHREAGESGTSRRGRGSLVGPSVLRRVSSLGGTPRGRGRGRSAGTGRGSEGWGWGMGGAPRGRNSGWAGLREGGARGMGGALGVGGLLLTALGREPRGSHALHVVPECPANALREPCVSL